MRGYLAALERLMAPVVTYGDVLLPPGSGDEALRVRDALAAALDTAPAAVRRLLPETVGAVPADERLLDYTLAALAAVRRYLDDRLAGHPVEQAAERATAALGRARAHVQAVDPALTGTWGRHDLELTHHFYAAALRV